MNMSRSRGNLRRFVLLSMFVAIELAMWATGLGQVPVGPLNMSFLTVPVAIGAMLLGVPEGTVLGIIFGLTSLYDAYSGRSVLTGFFFSHHPVHTVFLCVVMRLLMGLFTGLVYRAFSRLDKTRTLRYYIGALAAPLLNTAFFMGYICLFLYQTEMVQNIAAQRGAQNPFMFVVLLVGIQGLAEALTCCFVGGSVSKGVAHALRLDKTSGKG